jgi:hypothetical protein
MLTRSRFLEKPQWTSSYQGEVEYSVGHYVTGSGTPKVKIRHRLSYYAIGIANYPEEFWGAQAQSVGLVMWKYCPWQIKQHQHYPDPEIAAMFPSNRMGRYDENWNIEVQGGEFPVLVATIMGIVPKADYQGEVDAGYPILWEGTGPEMTKDVWFKAVFPHLSESEQTRIAQTLTRKNIEIPQ